MHWLLKTHLIFFQEKKVLNCFEIKIFSAGTQSQEKGIILLTPRQMLKTFTMTIAEVKAEKTYENLLNEICQIIYSL